MSTAAIDTEIVKLAIADGSEMAAYTAKPKSPGPHPGLIVLQEAFGVNEHIRDVTRRFAEAGYVSIAPELFHRTGPGFEGSYTDFASVMPHYQAVTNEGLGHDLTASYEWLRQQIGDSEKIATIGFCLGGKVSFLASTILPVAGAISFYGGGIAPNAMGPGLLDRAAEVKAPLLLVWGGKDTHLGPDQVAAVTSALDAAGKSYVNAVFSKADHGFYCDARASYDEESAVEAIGLAHAFLARHTH